MTLVTQVGAKSFTTAVTVFVSDAKIVLEQQSHKAQLTGVSFSTDYELSPSIFFRYQGLDGKGNLARNTPDYKFNRNLLYAYKTFSFKDPLLFNWNVTYTVGGGFSHRNSKFGNNSYEQLQLPLILGLEIISSDDVQISLSGFGQIDNLQNNRSGSLNFKVPIMPSVKLIGTYTNHKSKVEALKHCGSDYFLGFSIKF